MCLTYIHTQHRKVIETKQQLGFEEINAMHLHPRNQMRAILCFEVFVMTIEVCVLFFRC